MTAKAAAKWRPQLIELLEDSVQHEIACCRRRRWRFNWKFPGKRPALIVRKCKSSWCIAGPADRVWAARQAGIELLVLDTCTAYTAEILYKSMGFVLAGIIPDFARSTNGQLEACSFFYKKLA